jgi:NTE family protein
LCCCKKVYVCNGTACVCAGTQEKVIATLKETFDADEIGHMTCLGRCHENAAFHYKGKRLVDGGLLNPVPIAPTLRDLTDMTIAVSLSGKSKNIPKRLPIVQPFPEKHNKYHQKVIDFIDSLQHKNNNIKEDAGFFDIISKSLDVMQSTIANLKLAAYTPDIIIEIPKSVCTIYEFEKAQELIEIGRCEAEAVLKGTNSLQHK